MGGFKSGAADDDWGDTAATSVEEDDSTGEGDEQTESSVDRQPEPDTPSTAIETNTTSRGSGPAQQDLPWVLTRNSITDGREQTVQLHLQSSTLDVQREAVRTLEAELGESLKKADLREAALLVGLQHIDEMVAKLREWGYDIDQ